jgi:hypothetical protein
VLLVATAKILAVKLSTSIDQPASLVSPAAVFCARYQRLLLLEWIFCQLICPLSNLLYLDIYGATTGFFDSKTQGYKSRGGRKPTHLTSTNICI